MILRRCGNGTVICRCSGSRRLTSTRWWPISGGRNRTVKGRKRRPWSAIGGEQGHRHDRPGARRRPASGSRSHERRRERRPRASAPQIVDTYSEARGGALWLQIATTGSVTPGSSRCRAAAWRDRRAAVGGCRLDGQDAVRSRTTGSSRRRDSGERSKSADIAAHTAAAGSAGVGAAVGKARQGGRAAGPRRPTAPCEYVVCNEMGEPYPRRCCRGTGATP